MASYLGPTVLSALMLLVPSIVIAEPFQIVAWNLESGGIERTTIGRQLREFNDVHLWALSEVQSANADFFIASAGAGESGAFAGVIGNTGGADRLLIVLDETRFEVVDAYELDDMALGGRAPLVAQLRMNDNGKEFLFVALHFHRRSAAKRLAQAQTLRDWAAAQSLPIVAAGDCNFDYDIPDGPGNAAYDEFGLGGVFRWVQPTTLVATQYSDSNGDGRNDFNSVLDFIWTAGDAQAWSITSEIFVRPDDFPDDHRTSDHRPVRAYVDIEAVQPMATVPSRRLRIATGRSFRPIAAEAGKELRLSPRREASLQARGAFERQSLAAAGEFGRFEGRVVAAWDDSGREMTLLEDFHYLDSRGRRWTAPTQAVIDGASIPRPFWSIVGGPFEGRYRNASVVHDVYCDSQERPWREVHRMFYEACRCGGASLTQSKLMYYAVYHFGPRWEDSPAVMAAVSTRPLTESDVSALQTYIEWQQPSLSDLEMLPPATFPRQE